MTLEDFCDRMACAAVAVLAAWALVKHLLPPAVAAWIP